MCSCDWNYVCSQCKGTPFDPHYLVEHEPEPVTPDEFYALTQTHRTDDDWPERFWG